MIHGSDKVYTQTSRESTYATKYIEYCAIQNDDQFYQSGTAFYNHFNALVILPLLD